MQQLQVQREDKAGSAIQALAAGLMDAGCGFVTNYPGFHSNEMTDRMACGQTSVSENAAMALAWGAAFGGVRAVTAFKNVGLNDAADAYLNAHVLSINAGLVVVVFDDMDDEHSQMRQDSRHYFDFHGGLWFEPLNKQDAYEIALEAFALSERFQTPVTIRVTNILYRDSIMTGAYRRLKEEFRQKPRRRPIDPAGVFVTHPSNIEWQEKMKRERSRQLASYVEELHQPPEPGSATLIIGAGAGLEQEMQPGCDLFRIRTLPLPLRQIGNLMQRYRQVFLYEHGDPVCRDRINAYHWHGCLNWGRLSSHKPNRSYHNSEKFEKLFGILRSYNAGIVVGDLGQYTMDPHRTIDAVLSYGSSPAVAGGVAAAAKNSIPVFCVSGDGAFLHSGKNVLPELVARKLRLTILIFDNGGCAGTGGQQIPGDLTGLPAELKVQRVDFDGISQADLAYTIAEMQAYEGISVLILSMEKNDETTVRRP